MRAVDEQHTDARSRRRSPPVAGGATPIAKSWPSEWCLRNQQPGHPDPRRLRLHTRLPGRAVLARPPPEHDPRRHARHPGHGPAGPQVLMEGGKGLALLAGRINDTVERGLQRPRPAAHANVSLAPLQQVVPPPIYDGRAGDALATPCPTCGALATRCWHGCGWIWPWRRWPKTLPWQNQPARAACGAMQFSSITVAQDWCLRRW